MSNKVYGFCEAGCRYRIPTFDDFERSAGVIRQQAAEDGNFYLDAGKRYIIKNATESNEWKFSVKAECFATGGDNKVVNVIQNVPLPTYSVLDDCASIKIIATGVEEKSGVYYAKSYINGEATLVNLQLADEVVNSLRLIVSGSAKVCLVNEDANTINERGGDLPSIEDADEGKFLRVVNGKWQASKIASAEGASF